MNIQVMRLRGFMKHEDTHVELPPAGVVVVTGPNGAGKSSLVEAPATAFFGETLRGTQPWPPGGGSVEVRATEVRAKRTRTSAEKTLLEWTAGNDNPVLFETTTKAQQALERLTGAFNVWRRTHVFSSQDAAHFTMSTDAERKRLLEAILGLERFDVALAGCRAELKAVTTTSNEAQVQLNLSRARLDGTVQRVQDAEKALGALPASGTGDVPALEAEFKRLQGMLALCSKELLAARDAMRESDRAGAGLLAEARTVEAHLARLSAAQCPTCEQPIPAALRTALAQRSEKLRNEAQEAVAKAAVATAHHETLAEELEEEANAIDGKKRKLGEALRSARDSAAARDAAVKRLEGARADIKTLEATLVAQGKALEGARRAQGELEAVEVVLGLKGVRAHVLGRSLAGLEQVANGWLTRVVRSGLSLRLKPYAEKKAGGVSDSISLEVVGAGGGHGYRASSGGERRRIDVALLLALAEVAQAAHGQAPGTLFMDEVFDALDPEGEEAVIGVIQELAKDRAVVVITHSPSLAERLPATVRLNVLDGTVTRQ